jgi:hypothetical protein
MADYSERMKDYVQVNERIVAFYEMYPEGGIQSEIVEFSEKRVVVKAYAYRKPGDPLPGIGHSYMALPGKTTYTIGSELENTETSAWGRALASLGFEVKRGIASHNEIENKRHEHVEPEPPPDMDEIFPEPADSFQASSDEPVTDAQALSVTQWCRSFGVDFKAVFGPWFSVDKPEKMTNPQYAIFLEKRDAIVLGHSQRNNPPSKDIAKAEKIVNQAAERVRQQNPSTNTNGGISEGKQRRFWAIAKSKEVAKQILDQYGFTDPAEIPWKGSVYDEMCKAAEEANS